MSTLSVHNLRKQYGLGKLQVLAVDDISLAVSAGEITMVMGPSGSGKTTLLMLMGTLLKPTSGEVQINGNNIDHLNSKKLAKIRLKVIGFVFQHFNLLSALTAQENVMVPLLATGVNSRVAAKRAATLLDQIGLGERLTSLPKNLSGGEQQRVAIARAMINQPKLILADEPTANLDAKTGLEIVNILRKYAKQSGAAIVIVSHDTRIQAVADKVIQMEDGRITNV